MSSMLHNVHTRLPSRVLAIAVLAICLGCCYTEGIPVRTLSPRKLQVVSDGQANSSALITNLPKYVGPPIPFKQYAGYITVDETNGRNLFYWFVESQGNPQTDPLVVWFQGGPGCSSLLGFTTEHGPFVLNDDGSVSPNSLSWNKLANVLYIEAPAGVGFSYSKTPSDYNTNDEKTCIDNYAFLELWFQQYPQFATQDLYLAGESYAGNYVPQLARRILNGTDATLATRFKGFLLGNPVLSCPLWRSTDNSTEIELYFWHGMIPYSIYQKWRQAGCTVPNPPSSCASILDEVNVMIGNDINPDDLYSDKCTGNSSLGVDQGLNCVTMSSKYLSYLNSPEVQAAIHAQPTEWRACQLGSILNYTAVWQSMLPDYEYFFTNHPNLRIWIYSGDVDIATVPHAYTQMCLAELKNRTLTSKWRPWRLRDQIAGYVETYDRYTFATVKGAGHEVPTYQPFAAYYLFQQYLKGEVL